MKRIVVVSVLLIIFSFPRISGQNPNNERLNAYKIAFFTKRLNLTSGEAEKFWPVYNDFQNQKLQIHQERVLLNRTFNLTGNTMSDKEMTDLGDKIIALEIREAALSQQFHNKFRDILPPVKVLRLYQAENQYKQQLLNELQERKPVRNNMMNP